MSLPQINTPEYTLKLPSTDEEVRYRPFLVKEEKILLIAQETGGDKETYNAIRKIIVSCCLDPIDMDKLPLFDVEYLFLNIRAKSVGEVAKLKIKCPDDEETEVEIELDLTSIVVQMEDDHTNKIELTDTIGVILAYPNLATVEQQSIDVPKGKETTALFEMIVDCIDQIWEGEEVHDCTDYSKKELSEFLEGLDHTQFEKIQHFFSTMPMLKKEIEVTNPKTGVTSKMVLSGLQSFFS
jgi:hypothetical protein